MTFTLRDRADVALQAAADVAPAPDAVKHIAFKAMRALYPDETGSLLGVVLSYPAPNLAEGMAALYHGVGIFGEIEIDHVIGAMVTPIYGERAH